jgi:hypothetical protein
MRSYPQAGARKLCAGNVGLRESSTDSPIPSQGLSFSIACGLWISVKWGRKSALCNNPSPHDLFGLRQNGSLRPAAWIDIPALLMGEGADLRFSLNPKLGFTKPDRVAQSRRTQLKQHMQVA